MTETLTSAPEPEESIGSEIAASPKPWSIPEDFFHIPRKPTLESFAVCPSCDEHTLLIGYGCQALSCGALDYSTP